MLVRTICCNVKIRIENKLHKLHRTNSNRPHSNTIRTCSSIANAQTQELYIYRREGRERNKSKSGCILNGYYRKGVTDHTYDVPERLSLTA